MKIITQRKNTHKFKIIGREKIAGLRLTGNEIKAIRNYQISISDAYVLPYKNELFLYKTSISPYRYASQFSQHDTTSQKPRKLLMKKKEIKHLITQIKTKHYNLIPLRVFINERGWAKTEIALVQTLRKYQVKKDIKDKEIKRKLQRKEYD
ncbi:SsrA-binding protein [endosymbiont GvMRE of Glomus versiforme]|uniref:SsrA-binding protein n=1 Tax=endosymbiont GvMRE of Glomus versiforme TaxID=2039283 RepID=UPI000EE0B3BB|nr:SsrA-binding protein [endosymbiont GvMRE of Glomus versiforme]RHZ37244.1 SsrA-binding protein [endosymbiont GvMRE of Glomus versiforme]